MWRIVRRSIVLIVVSILIKQLCTMTCKLKNDIEECCILKLAQTASNEELKAFKTVQVWGRMDVEENFEIIPWENGLKLYGKAYCGQKKQCYVRIFMCCMRRHPIVVFIFNGHNYTGMQLCQEIQIHSGKNMSGCLWIWLNGSAWRTLVKMSCTVYTGNRGCGVCGRIVMYFGNAYKFNVYFRNAYKFQQETGRNQETFEKLKKINLKC